MTRITDVREAAVNLGAKIRNSVIDFSKMTVSLVAVVSDGHVDGRPAVGLCFNSIGRYAASGILRERFIPRLLEVSPDEYANAADGEFDPARVSEILMRNEKPGGHGERSSAVAAIEIAAWDLAAKLRGVPLYRLLADRFNRGRFDTRVPVYAAGGYYYAEDDIARLSGEMRGYLEQGYTHLKMKVGGAPLDEDCKRIEAVLTLVEDGSHLAVDANGRFDLETAIAYAERLEPYGLRWYEEPVDPLDFALQVQLVEHYDGAFATGENLFSHQEVRNLLRFGGLEGGRDFLQMDPALSYGVVELARMLDSMRTENWSPRRLIPHGGHLMGLHAAAGMQLGGNESYPGVFQPFSGFGTNNQVIDGTVEIADTPGTGLEYKPELEPVLGDLIGDLPRSVVNAHAAR
jgi:L-alanine-DL-glutamate epimerase-like enolase superfamily enzyme